MTVRSNQTGSIASFIVIGVVLVILTAGTLYWVSHKDTPSVAEKSGTTSQPAKTPAKTDDKTAQPNATDDSTPAAEPTATPQTSASASTSSPSAAAPSVSSLSQTGPADTAVELLAIGALAAAVASFIRSRNLRSSL